MNFMKSIYSIICSGFNLEIENVYIIKENEIIVYLPNNATAYISLEK